MSTGVAPPRTRFALPPDLSATEPPEFRGLARDHVRLLVSRPDGVQHLRFTDLQCLLSPGDLVVVNTSRTLPAAVEAHHGGENVVVHFSSPHSHGAWVVELRKPDGSGPLMDSMVGAVIELPAGVHMELSAAHPDPTRESSRLWRASFDLHEPVETYLERHGHPISYGYLRSRWSLSSYQTIFARDSGSAEMPSAARPFSHRLVVEMLTRGISFAPITLHCGVSSLETKEPPQPERFHVPSSTARLVNQTKAAGGRVVAVGTTVTRALETNAAPDGGLVAARGETTLVLGPERPARVVDGLVTGWHPPNASHLLLLDAVAGVDLTQQAYDAALQKRYLWHEFGDSCLLLPPLRNRNASPSARRGAGLRL